jgi:hypothetical protein
MHSHTEALNDLAHKRAESIAIRWHEENVLAMIAAQNHVVQTTFNMKARRSGHPCRSGAGFKDEQSSTNFCSQAVRISSGIAQK